MSLIERPANELRLRRARGVAPHWAAIAGAAMLVLMTMPGSAREESAIGESAAAPVLVEDSGLIGAITRWVDESAATIASHVKSARESIDSAADRAAATAKDAAAAAAAAPRLPNTAVVTGRERCAAAANGAADCSGAIASLCRAKGFTTGRVLDIEATRKCSPEILLSGRVPSLGDCGSESFVTRPMCQ
jgi:hypothetical protein